MEPGSYIGTTDYDAQDRGAILNLLKKVTVYYDFHDLDSYMNCYRDDGAFLRYAYDNSVREVVQNLELTVDGPWPAVVENGITYANMQKYFQNAIDQFVEQGKQTRHIGSSYTVNSQDGDTAKATFYVLLTNTQNYETLTMMLTAVYNADLVKVGEDWKIKTLYVYIDSALNR